MGAFGPSGSAHEDTYYDYHVYELDAGPLRAGLVNHPGARFFQYQDLIESDNVSWSIVEIARAMVEFQEASLAVITRRLNGQCQFLVIYNPAYGYFFPAARRKTTDPPEVMAVKAVAWDTFYQGELQATWCGEAVDTHQSTRFVAVPGWREYRWHVCNVVVEGVDLNRPANAFAAALDAHERAKRNAGQSIGSRGYWGWFTEEELRNHKEISPTTAAVLPTILRCAGTA